MTKPIIIAICGKSASGKDTLAKKLHRHLCKKNLDAGLIVSDTTRPKRDYEVQGVDYNYIPHMTFLDKQYGGEYLEWAEFKGWRYGTHRNEVSHAINIGVFNPTGTRKLFQHQRDFIIIPVLLEVNLFARLKRSYQRENRWQWEYLRRAWYDYKDFNTFDNEVRNARHWLILDDYDTKDAIYVINLLLEKEGLI